MMKAKGEREREGQRGGNQFVSDAEWIDFQLQRNSIFRRCM